MNPSTGRGVLSDTVPWVCRVWLHPANRNRRCRQLVWAVAYQFRNRAFNEPVATRLGERSWIWADRSLGAASLVVYANPPDYLEWEVWRRHLSSGDLFVDVGANVGVYTILAAELGTSVVAVEPNPEMLAWLDRNLELNGMKAEVVASVFADRPGSVRFLAEREACKNSILLATDGRPSVEVSASTYDDVLGRRVAAGVKIDVEGAERLVLQGAENALARGDIGLLQIEWNELSQRTLGESREPIRSLLAQHGYDLYRPTANGELRPLADNERPHDIFAARPESIRAILAS
jgi:FkbM family methyltransferase